MNYKRIAEALDFYTKSRCEYIDLPWAVPEAIANVTCPPGRQHFYIKDNVLIGSAEQAFLQLAIEGKLVSGRNYVACTPCFRDEPVIDELHKQYFMKVELFCYSKYGSVCIDAEEFFYMLAKRYFTTQGAKPEHLRVDDRQEDLLVNGIEVGSYREAELFGQPEEFYWACGTGLAEPRFTYALGSTQS